MNARLYDAALGRFLSPDPYVQASDQTQNYNRYIYCLNNPLKYTDQNGKWIHLVIGAVLGGVINWANNGAEFTWKGLGYFGVGALAGALGAGVGAGISSTLPVFYATPGGFWAGFAGSQSATMATSCFWTGAAIGGGGGFASGFTTGLGNNLLLGKGFDYSVGQGFQSGLALGASGALSMGLCGGIMAGIEGRTFWRGGRVTKEVLATDPSLTQLELKEQKGEFGCADNAFDNISRSINRSEISDDIRQSLVKGLNQNEAGMPAHAAVNKFAESYGRTVIPRNIGSVQALEDAYIYLGEDKLLFVYPTDDKISHMVNVVEATRKTIEYPNGSQSTNIMYKIFDNGHSRTLSSYDLFFRGREAGRRILYRITIP